MQIIAGSTENWHKIKIHDCEGVELKGLIYFNTETGAYEQHPQMRGGKSEVGILQEGFTVKMPKE